MKSKFLTFLLFIASFKANSQLYIKNNFDKPYKVSFAFFFSGQNSGSWVSKGWFEVLPGEEKQVYYSNPTNKTVYYFAVSENDTISGNTRVLVNPDTNETYTINNADLNETKEKNPHLEWFEFVEVKRGNISNRLSKKSTIVLGEK